MRRTTKTKNLEENMVALEITLTLVESNEIREASEAAEVFGERYLPRQVLPPSLPLACTRVFIC
jgi:hypothetical protein